MKKLGYLFLAMFSSLMLAACAEQKSEEKEKEKEVITTSANQSEWSYEESTGPEHWGELDPSNLTCVNGSEQSPINVEFPEVKADQKVRVRFTMNQHRLHLKITVIRYRRMP